MSEERPGMCPQLYKPATDCLYSEKIVYHSVVNTRTPGPLHLFPLLTGLHLKLDTATVTVHTAMQAYSHGLSTIHCNTREGRMEEAQRLGSPR